MIHNFVFTLTLRSENNIYMEMNISPTLMNLNFSKPTTSNQYYEPQSEGVKDGILFNSLYRMTFMPGCRPILSPGVARRQNVLGECILGNDESDEWNPQPCHLLSAFTTVIKRVNGKKSSILRRKKKIRKWVWVAQVHYGRRQTNTCSVKQGCLWGWSKFCEPELSKEVQSLSFNLLQIKEN